MIVVAIILSFIAYIVNCWIDHLILIADIIALGDLPEWFYGTDVMIFHTEAVTIKTSVETHYTVAILTDIVIYLIVDYARRNKNVRGRVSRPL